MSPEEEPWTGKTAPNSVADGEIENPVIMPPSSGNRWRQNHKLSKTLCIMLLTFLLLTLLLFLIASGLAIYYGSVYHHCSANTVNLMNLLGSLDKSRDQQGKSDVSTDDLFNKMMENIKNRSHRNVRLPYTVLPRFYDLVLQVHIHQGQPSDFFFNGSVNIKVYCRETTDVLYVHAYDRLNITQKDVRITGIDENGKLNEIINLKNFTYDDELQWLKMELTEQLKAGQYYQIVFGHFSRALAEDLKGWYLSKYIEKGKQKYLATSQLQPTDARRVFPCWDEPGFKAQFQVTIIRNKNFHSLSNMGKLESKPLGGDWYADVFAPTVNTSTYLLAFVVSQFDSIATKDSKGRNFTVWARPEKIHLAKYALKIGQEIIRFFEEYFEVPYPLEKTDMIAVPDFAAGAMENWGLMIYREATMLWDPETGTAPFQQKVATVVSHEIAHQWFGNLVTLNWWDDLWLNEGFASFIECIGVDHVHPEWGMDEQFLLEDMQKVLISDSFTTSRPVFQPVSYPNEINEIFDPISYNKGAAVLRMMESFLGQDAFRLGLKNYLSSHKFRNTGHDDLWRSLTEAAKSVGKTVDVKSVMDSWLLQMNYPLVTVTRLGPTTFQFEQSHYLEPPDAKPPTNSSPYNFQWQIPLTYGSPNTKNWGKNEVIWLKNKSMIHDLEIGSSPWYVFNVRVAGFYRVHYADSNWEAITRQLLTDPSAMPIHTRIQVLDDLFALANRGNVSYTVFLNLTKYLKNEDSYVAWETARGAFGFVTRMLAIDSSYGKLQAYIRLLIDKQLQKVDWETMREDKDHMKHMLRETVSKIACSAGHRDCVEKAKFMFRKYMADNTTNSIPRSLRAAVYCTAIQWGGQQEWQFLDAQLRTGPKDEETSIIRSALACTRDMWIMKSYLQSILESEVVESHDLLERITYVALNPMGHLLMWDHVREAWRRMVSDRKNNRTSEASPAMSMLLKILSKRPYAMNNLPPKDEFVDFEGFSKTELEESILHRGFRELSKRSEQNAAWTKSHRNVISHWLSEAIPNENILL
ncbi:unnamed protein product [Calicophoron daubneyi]|uniref:Aminopeptidase n=1 Tax=Calicophoron daubneyi TaxID=300641 RepID=A0AAV2TZ67_CALDB